MPVPLLIRATIIVLICSMALGSAARAQTGCPAPTADGAIQVAVTPRADNSLIADAVVSSTSPAAMYLEYGNSTVGWLRTPTSAVTATNGLPLLRLRAETSYQVRAFALDQVGCPASVGLAEFSTGRLPDLLEALTPRQVGRPSWPLTLIDHRPPDSEFRSMVMFDQDGQIVWYYIVPDEIPLLHTGVTVVHRTNGNLLYMARAFGIEEITPDGKVVRRVEVDSRGVQEIHHDLVELPGNQLLFLGLETRTIDDTVNGGPRNLRVLGDTLRVLSLDSNVEQPVWSAFDALDPTQRTPEWIGRKYANSEDWTHANTVSVGPAGNIVLSLRHLNQVISLSPDFKEVQWKLGGPGSSFSFADPDDRFYAQHDAWQLPNGHVVMFDNGNFRPAGEYSRGLEIELDFATMTARKVWEYRPALDLYSERFGSAARQPNGNTLISFGWRTEPDEPVVLAEARPDGSAAWTLELAMRGTRPIVYRAYVWQTLMGETPVDPTPVVGS